MTSASPAARESPVLMTTTLPGANRQNDRQQRDTMTTMNGQTREAHDAAASVLVPFEVPPVRLAGPVSHWPLLRPEETASAVAAKGAREAVGGDTVIRILTAFVVLAVAAFAAVVSYSHIFDLGIHHGQSGTAARLLPLSVDGLIAAASLVMLHAARNKLPVPLLSRLMLALGVGATVAANVAYGLPFGWLSAVVSAWPAAAFVGSVEMAIRFVSDARHVATASAADDGAAASTEPDICMDKTLDKETAAQDIPAVRDTDKPQAARTRRAVTGLDKAADIIRRNPGLSNAEVAKRARVSEKTVSRARVAAAVPRAQDIKETS